MRDIFWKKLSGINASLFMMLAMLLLLASLLWISRPREHGVIQVGNTGISEPENGYKGRGDDWRGKRLTNIEDVGVDVSNSPFSSKYLQQTIAERKEQERLAKEKAQAEKEGSDDGSSNGDESTGSKAKAQSAEAESKGQPEAPRNMKLIYRGMLTTLDGGRRALVDMPDQDKSEYYRDGERIGWTKIVEFTPRSMRLTGDEADYTLRRGVETEIVEGGE